MTSLLERLGEAAAATPDKVALTFLNAGSDGGKVERTLTYKQLANETERVASNLLSSKHGLKKGDLAVLVYPPSLDFMVAFLSCLKAGIVAVPVFPPHPARRDTLVAFSRIVKGCGAKYALTSKTYNHMKKLGGIKDNFTRLKRSNGADDDAKWPDDMKWIVTDDSSSGSKPVASSAKTPLDSSITAEDLAFLQFTSGSTSDPKGVMITHGNLQHNLTIITNELKAKDDTVVVSWLPQYHDMGLIGSYLGVLYCGGSGYYMSPLTFLQRPMIWMEAVSKYKATHLQAPNFAFKLAARKFYAQSATGTGSLNFSSVRHIINGAEPVTADSIDSFVKTFGPFGLRREVIYPTYGLAEHTVFVCSGGKQRLEVFKEALEMDGLVKVLNGKNSGEGDSKSTLLGCGYPARQGVDVKIVTSAIDDIDETDKLSNAFKEVGEDCVGEIWISSPSKASGYWKNEEKTREAFQAILTDEKSGSSHTNAGDGYLRTGDMGFLHNEELFICGRIKDLIIVGGRNYYPQDIEATAQAAVNSIRPGCVAAFSIDPVGAAGEDVALIAELRESPKGDDAETILGPIAAKIKAAVNQEHSLGIASIVLLRPRTIPKTTSGKIARARCRKAFVGNSLDTLYKKSFKVDSGDVEGSTDNGDSKAMKPLEGTNSPCSVITESVDPRAIRSMDKADILSRLVADVCKLGSMTPEMVDKNSALVSILDSLSISQFKGMLEHEYATTLSDEYLFRENTTIMKLVEVVKLGYAPDDGGEEGGATSNSHAHAVSAGGNTGGLAGALGCPPGVVCCVVS